MLLPIAVALLYRCQSIVDNALALVFESGSGTGIRTLNLAVNRSTRPVQKSWSEFAACRCVPPFATV